MDNTAHTSEERIWAALAHASGLLFLFGLAPLLIWVAQRKKSTYIAFHALQALGYQIISVGLWSVLSIILPFVFTFFLIPIVLIVEKYQPGSETFQTLTPFVFTVLITVVVLGIFGIYWFVCLFGTVRILMDKDFRYPLLGNWLGRYLRYRPEDTQALLDVDAQDRWVVAMGHSSISVMFFGMLNPLITWLAERNRSLLIRFQSLQTLIYQGIGVVAYFLAQICTMVFYFLFLGSAIFAGSQAKEFGNTNAASGLAIFFIVFLCCGSGVLAFAMPAYYLLGQFAAMQVIRGRNFKYPLIGSFIWGRQKNSLSLEKKIEAGTSDVNS